MKAMKKAAVVGLVCLFLERAGANDDQRLLTYDRTVETALGKFGVWEVTELGPSYTDREYWIFFGRLGRWHLRTSTHGKATPLFPIVVVVSMLGAVVLVARQRRSASASEQIYDG
jgi:hypothetical protein